MKAPRRRWIAPVLAALALGALPGCPSTPTIRLDHAEVRSASPAGLGIQVVVRVHNPNGFDVQVRAIRASVTIAGRFPLQPLEFTPNTWLPAGKTTLISVPVVIPWLILPAVVAASVGSPSVTYQVQGTADVTAVRALGIERNNYPVSESGVIPRQVMIDTARTVLPL